MFTVTGTFEGAMYQARWSEQDEGESDRCVESTLPQIRPLLMAHAGEAFLATPTGPALVLDFADGASVLTALSSLTDVSEVAGDLPQDIEDDEPGRVY
jgi:hypothetical protein